MNNDRFKFRVWDNEEKCYSTACFFLSVEGELYIFIGGVVHKANPEIYIVEKCTGLEDENGKLIFEGDKVRMTEFYFDGCGESERNFVGYVMWNLCFQKIQKNQNTKTKLKSFPTLAGGIRLKSSETFTRWRNEHE